MTKICYVYFSDRGRVYSYFCGGLNPKPDDKVLVKVGNQLKIVTVAKIGDGPDSYANTEILGIVQLQPDKKGEEPA